MMMMAACYLCWQVMGLSGPWSLWPFKCRLLGHRPPTVRGMVHITCIATITTATITIITPLRVRVCAHPAACITSLRGWTFSGLGEASDIMNMSAIAACTVSMMRDCSARLIIP